MFSKMVVSASYSLAMAICVPIQVRLLYMCFVWDGDHCWTHHIFLWVPQPGIYRFTGRLGTSQVTYN